MKKLWKFTLTNIDTIIAVVVSILATVFGIFGGNQVLLLAGIASTLTILAIGLIRDRHNREILSEQIAELRASLPDQPSAMAFFRPLRDFDMRLNNALQIDLCGVSLTNTISSKFAALRSRIEAGANLRILVVDPDSHSIEMTTERSVNPKDTMYFRRRLESTFSELTYLQKFVNDLKRKGRKGTKVGKFSVRLLSYAPSFGILSLNAQKQDGIVYVEIYPHKFGFENPPTFILTQDNDRDWYTYFVDQFEQMWKSSKIWDPSPYIEKMPFDDNVNL